MSHQWVVALCQWRQQRGSADPFADDSTNEDEDGGNEEVVEDIPPTYSSVQAVTAASILDREQWTAEPSGDEDWAAPMQTWRPFLAAQRAVSRSNAMSRSRTHLGMGSRRTSAHSDAGRSTAVHTDEAVASHGGESLRL